MSLSARTASKALLRLSRGWRVDEPGCSIGSPTAGGPTRNPEGKTMTIPTVPTKVSRSELERRWTEVRAAMGVAGIDVLIAQADAGPYLGYVRYLADLVPPDSSGLTLVFPLE